MPLGKRLLASLLTFAACAIFGCKHDPARDRAKFMKSAEAYQQDKKYKEAMIQYSNALKADPNCAEAHYGLATTLLYLKSPVQAYQELLRTVDLQPSNIKARIDLAEVMIGGGLTKEPQEQTTAILALDPHNGDAYSIRAQLEAQAGHPNEAIDQIRQAIAAAPDRAEYRSQLALALLATPTGQVEAEAELNKAIAAAPDQAYPHLLLASLRDKAGDHAAAESELLAAKAAAPTDTATRAALARHYGLAGNAQAEEAALISAANDLPDATGLPETLGNFYLRTNQLAHGTTVFETLHRGHPKSIPVAVAFANLLDSTGQGPKAREVATQLMKTNAHDPVVIAVQARFLIEDRKTDEAFQLLQTGVKDNTGSVPLKLLFGQLAEAKGDLATAETNYQAAVSFDPTNLRATAALASVALKKRDYLLLTRIADNTLKLNPGYAPALLWRATAEAGQSQFEKASVDAEAALKQDPKNTDAYRLLAELRLQQHKDGDARKLLEQAHRIDPSAPAVITQLNRLDTASGHTEAAIARLHAQIEHSPNASESYSDLALLQLQTNDKEGAYANARKALSLQASDPQTIAIYSNAAIATGHFEEATATLMTLLSAHPGNPTAISALGNLAENGDRNKAIDLYRQTLKADPQNAMALNNLAYLITESGQNLDEALTYAQQSQRLTPHLPSSTDTLAWVYYRKGAFRPAQDLLEDAAKTDPGNASVQYHLGLTYEQLHDRARAAQHLQKAASLSPKSDTGRSAAAALAQLQ